jgi:hypothetical protein
VILKYLNIIKKIEISEIRMREKSKKKHNLHIFSLGLIIAFISIAFISLFLYKGTERKWLLVISQLSLISAYITVLLTPFIDAYTNRKGIYRTLTIPFNCAININVKKEGIVDCKKLPKLLELNSKTLELGLMEIKHEKNFLEKIMLIIVGPIEKLGLLPGILATLAMVFRTETPNEWVTIIAYSYIGLMLLSITFHHLLARYERMIALTELAISLKKENK